MFNAGNQSASIIISSISFLSFRCRKLCVLKKTGVICDGFQIIKLDGRQIQRSSPTMFRSLVEDSSVVFCHIRPDKSSAVGVRLLLHALS